MKNEKIFLMLALIALTLVLSGCTGYNDIMFSSYESDGKEYTQSYKTNGGKAIYVKKNKKNSGNYFVNLKIGANYEDYGCYEIIVNDKKYVGIGRVSDNLRATIYSSNIKAPGLNTIKITIYEKGAQVNGNRICSGESKSLTLPKMGIDDGLPNKNYIDPDNILSILNNNGQQYYDLDNSGIIRPCSYYGLADTQASIPACLALSQLGKTEKDCVRFFKKVYRWSKGEELSEFYPAFDSYPHYTSTTANTSSLVTSKVYMMSQYIGKINDIDTGHASIVYYNNNDKKWYAVGGNISDKVQKYTVQETLKYCANGWKYYSFREF